MEILSDLIEAHIILKTDDEIKFLLLKRSKEEIYPGIWQMVTGSVKPNEKGFECALREIKEETNLTPLEMWVVPNINSFYSSERNSIIMVPVFVCTVDSEDVQISSEHSECRWVNKSEAVKMLAWLGQKKSVEIIEDYFLNNQNELKFVEIKIY
ncbi:MAG: NUDIX domain-containing protein [Bacteroidetes bacterium]|nr:NUDIX domain-containing protein [Bacteroidota bacterium]